MKDFVPYEPSLALKELGFDEPCFGHYWEKLFYSQTTHHHPATMPNSPESCLAPTFSQAFRFFREKYNLVIVIKPISDIKLELGYNITKNGLIIKACSTYEEAELACLIKLIETVKTKQP